MPWQTPESDRITGSAAIAATPSVPVQQTAPGATGGWVTPAKDVVAPKQISGAPTPQDQTTVGGVVGAVERGLAPVATGMAAGAGIGATIGGPIGAVGGATIGAGAVGLTELLTAAYKPLAQRFGWPEIATPKEMTDKVLDAFGVKRSASPTERMIETTAGGAAGAAGSAAAAGQIERMATSPVVKGVARKLAEAPGTQTVAGATGALAGQAAAESGAGPVGQFAASVAGGLFGGGPSSMLNALSSRSPEQVDRFVEQNFTKAVRPTVAGKQEYSQLEKDREKAQTAIQTIIDNKANLNLVDDLGRKIEGSPQSIDQFAQAIDQTKDKIFKEYDALQKRTTQQGAKVDLLPVVSELSAFALNREIRDLDPGAARFAEKTSKALWDSRAYSPEEAQNAIRRLNDQLKSFYSSGKGGSKAVVRALIAGKLREQLDNVITNAVGPGYQDLKNKWGALRTIEKYVVHRAQIHARQSPSGLIANLWDISSAAEAIKGLATLHPAALASAGGMQALKEIKRHMNDPNRMVRRMFEVMEKGPSKQPVAPGYGALSGAYGFGAISPIDQAMRQAQ